MRPFFFFHSFVRSFVNVDIVCLLVRPFVRCSSVCSSISGLFVCISPSFKCSNGGWWSFCRSFSLSLSLPFLAALVSVVSLPRALCN